MKVFDSTALIAFISEMDFPQGLTALSAHYTLYVPEGVVAEITRPKTKEGLNKLILQKILKLRKADQQRVAILMNDNPQLGRGECEAVAIAESLQGTVCVISDDQKAHRKLEGTKFKWTQRLLDIMKEKGVVLADVHMELMHRLDNSPFYGRGKKA